MQFIMIVIAVVLAVAYLIYAGIKRYKTKKACDKCPIITQAKNNRAVN